MPEAQLLVLNSPKPPFKAFLTLQSPETYFKREKHLTISKMRTQPYNRMKRISKEKTVPECPEMLESSSTSSSLKQPLISFTPFLTLLSHEKSILNGKLSQNILKCVFQHRVA